MSTKFIKTNHNQEKYSAATTSEAQKARQAVAGLDELYKNGKLTGFVVSQLQIVIETLDITIT